jgi:hypothetical protein
MLICVNYQGKTILPICLNVVTDTILWQRLTDAENSAACRIQLEQWSDDTYYSLYGSSRIVKSHIILYLLTTDDNFNLQLVHVFGKHLFVSSMTCACSLYDHCKLGQLSC